MNFTLSILKIIDSITQLLSPIAALSQYVLQTIEELHIWTIAPYDFKHSIWDNKNRIQQMNHSNIYNARVNQLQSFLKIIHSHRFRISRSYINPSRK